MAWVMPRRVVDLLACWRGIWGNHQIAAIWKMVPLCLIWCIWLQRNDRYFKDRERSLGGLRDLFFPTLFLWASAIGMGPAFITS